MLTYGETNDEHRIQREMGRMKFFAIRNTQTGEYFTGLRGQRLWLTKGAATNSFNQAHRKRSYDSNAGFFQAQTVWVHVPMVAIEDVQ